MNIMLKGTILLLICFVAITHLALSQKLQPSATQALVEFTVTDRAGKDIKTAVFFFGEKTNTLVTVPAGKEHKILLPVGETYSVYCENTYDVIRFPLADAPNQYFKLSLAFKTEYSAPFTISPFFAIIRIQLFNHAKEPQANVPIILSGAEDGKLTSQAFTDRFGQAEVQVPYNRDYDVAIGTSKRYTVISIPKTTFYHLDKLIQYEGKHVGELQPTQDSALFNLSYLDPNRKAVRGEIFYLTSSSGKHYQTKQTDWQGKCQIKVPIGDEYHISAKYFPDLTSQSVESKPGLYFFEIEFIYPSSKEIERRERDRERKIIVRDSLFKIEVDRMTAQQKLLEDIAELERSINAQKDLHQQDSLARLRQKLRHTNDSLWQAEQKQIQHYVDSVNTPTASISGRDDSTGNIRISHNIPVSFNNNSSLKDQVLKEKNEVEIEMINNPRLFETVGYEICAVFYRMRREWKSKIVVADLTRSMEPFAKQLLLWTALEINRKEPKRFVFFNDGDHLPDGLIGLTGGLHEIRSNNLDTLIDVMQKTIRAGDGGKSPENDIEALLRGAARKGRYDELILIADNYSHVRDMELLYSLSVPVRIILCGVNENNPPHEDYLQIAHRTKGSIHTIEYDLLDLASTLDNQRIKIGKSEYLLIRGRFVLLNKM